MPELSKPNIDSEKLLSTEEASQVKLFIKGLCHIDAIPAKNDYVDDFSRGTVLFNVDKGNPFNKDVLKMRNYSFHKVIIPDGTEIKGCNFTQKDPHTIAIQGKNLIFKECNLKNVEIDNSWTLDKCLTIHAREVIDGEDKVYQVEKDGKFVEVSRASIGGL
jgi:hypothetical protein